MILDELGDAVETFIRREDAERFIAEVRGDDPELASYLRGAGAQQRGAAGEAARDDLPSLSAIPLNVLDGITQVRGKLG